MPIAVHAALGAAARDAFVLRSVTAFSTASISIRLCSTCGPDRQNRADRRHARHASPYDSPAAEGCIRLGENVVTIPKRIQAAAPRWSPFSGRLSASGVARVPRQGGRCRQIGAGARGKADSRLRDQVSAFPAPYRLRSMVGEQLRERRCSRWRTRSTSSSGPIFDFFRRS